ncbi:hypothetical protein ABZ470_17935 [Streptosporangium sp. NPDC020072]|uniref:hypothetical protein n=1 Tax=Streptosporangium sp. NPDC020072 TaxID=3154788 RepID=UPI003433C3DA
MTGIEDRLRDALAARAEAVTDDGRPRVLPEPHRPLARPGWWAPVAVAAAMVLVVGVVVVGTRTRLVTAPRPVSSSGALPPPIRQVWPDAVHEIPATGPGGRTFTPETFVTDWIVVGQSLKKDRFDGLWAYDVARRRFTLIASLNEPIDGSPAFEDGHLAWSTTRGRTTEVWTVSIAGGTPRRLARFPAALDDDDNYEGMSLAVADNAVVWSPPGGGVYRVPLKGGKVSLIEGTKGQWLVEWPWAGWPRRGTMTDQSVPRPMEHLRNVLTGETRDAVPPAGHTSWYECGLTWCYGGSNAWRRDGTGLHAMPGSTGGASFLGRVVLLDQTDHAGNGGRGLYDAATRRSGLLFPVRASLNPKDHPPGLFVEKNLFWFKKDKKTLVLVNPNAIIR